MYAGFCGHHPITHLPQDSMQVFDQFLFPRGDCLLLCQQAFHGFYEIVVFFLRDGILLQ